MDTTQKIYDFVMQRLRDRAIPQRQVARESGVPFSTVSKIAQGAVKDPGVHTVQRLADYFSRQSGGSESARTTVHQDQQSAA